MEILFVVTITIATSALVSFFISQLESLPVELISVSTSLLITATVAFINFLDGQTFNREYIYALIFMWLTVAILFIVIVSAYKYHTDKVKKKIAKGNFGDGDKGWAVVSYFISALFSGLALFFCLLLVIRVELNLNSVNLESDTLATVGSTIFGDIGLGLNFGLIFIFAVILTFVKMKRVTTQPKVKVMAP